MDITYAVIVSLITLTLGAITKAFIAAIPNRFIPIQNLFVGIISAIICIYYKVETDVLQAFVLCIGFAMGAGGVYDLSQTKINK